MHDMQQQLKECEDEKQDTEDSLNRLEDTMRQKYDLQSLQAVLKEEYEQRKAQLDKRVGDIQKARGREAAKASVDQQWLEEEVEKLKRENEVLKSKLKGK